MGMVRRVWAATLILILVSSAWAGEHQESPSPKTLCQRFLTGAKGLILQPTSEYVGETQHLGFTTPIIDYYAPDQVRLAKYAEKPVRRVLSQSWLRLKEAYQFFGRRWVGLFRGSRGHFRDCVLGDPEYALTLGQGLQTCFVDLPVQSTMWVAKDKLYRAGLLTSVAAWMSYSYVLSEDVVHPAVVYYAQGKELRQLVEYNDFYVHQLKYNILFAPFKERLREDWPQENFAQFQAKRIVLEGLRERLKGIQSFLGDFDYQKSSYTKDEIAQLVRETKVFRHLNALDQKYNLLDREESIRPEIWRDIFIANWLMHGINWNATDLIQKPVELLKNLGPESLIGIELQEFLKSDFYKSVQKHRAIGDWSDSEAAALIREFYFYRVRLFEAEALGLPAFGEAWSDVEKQILERGLKEKERWQLPENFEKLNLLSINSLSAQSRPMKQEVE